MITIEKNQSRRGDWSWCLTSDEPLTDGEAADLTFVSSACADVTGGSYVEVRDPEGIRIGCISRIEFKSGAFTGGYVLVGIELR